MKYIFLFFSQHNTFYSMNVLFVLCAPQTHVPCGLQRVVCPPPVLMTERLFLVLDSLLNVAWTSSAIQEILTGRPKVLSNCSKVFCTDNFSSCNWSWLISCQSIFINNAAQHIM